MKKYLFLLLALPLMFSCGDGGKSEADRIKDSLNAVNGGLRGEVGKKDSTIESFIKSFNQHTRHTRKLGRVFHSVPIIISKNNPSHLTRRNKW